MKRFIAMILALLLCSVLCTPADAAWRDYVKVTGYDPKVDYSAEMMNCLNEGTVSSLRIGVIFEEQRNAKIKALNLPYKQTHYFSTYFTVPEIRAAMTRDKWQEPIKRSYTNGDLDLLARLIRAEAGGCPDWVQQAVGSVVLNRVASSKYPNTIYSVIYQRGQYSPTWNGSINRAATAQNIKNAKIVLESGGTIPKNVLYQAQFRQGTGVWRTYTTRGSTEYFCYG